MAATLLITALVAVGCTDPDPDPVAFPMPDEFRIPDTGRSVQRVQCEAAEASALDLEPESPEWARYFRTALEISAARTLVDNPDTARPSQDPSPPDDAANPWGMDDDELAMLQDPDYWAGLCDIDQFGGDEIRRFTSDTILPDGDDEMSRGLVFGFSANVRSWSDPYFEPYEHLLQGG